MYLENSTIFILLKKPDNCESVSKNYVSKGKMKILEGKKIHRESPILTYGEKFDINHKGFKRIQHRIGNN